MQFCVPHLPPPPTHLPPESTHPWLALALVPEAKKVALDTSALGGNKGTRSQGGDGGGEGGGDVNGGGGGGGEEEEVVNINNLSQEGSVVEGGSLGRGSLKDDNDDNPYGSTPLPPSPPTPPYILSGRIHHNLFEYTHTQKDLDENTFDTSMLGSRDSSAGGARRALNVGVRDLYFPQDPPSTVNITPVYRENEDLTSKILPDNESLGYGVVKFYEDNNRAMGTFSYHKATESSQSPSSSLSSEVIAGTTTAAVTTTTDATTPTTAVQAVLLVGPIIGPPKIQLYKPKVTTSMTQDGLITFLVPILLEVDRIVQIKAQVCSWLGGNPKIQVFDLYPGAPMVIDIGPLAAEGRYNVRFIDGCVRESPHRFFTISTHMDWHEGQL